jgi:hypothetical protein
MIPSLIPCDEQLYIVFISPFSKLVQFELVIATVDGNGFTRKRKLPNYAIL